MAEQPLVVSVLLQGGIGDAAWPPPVLELTLDATKVVRVAVGNKTVVYVQETSAILDLLIKNPTAGQDVHVNVGEEGKMEAVESLEAALKVLQKTSAANTLVMLTCGEHYAMICSSVWANQTAHTEE